LAQQDFSAMLAPGTKLSRCYGIRSKLAKGGMGEVYLVLDSELNHQALATNEQRVRRFIEDIGLP
jgi:hypothetical protein